MAPQTFYEQNLSSHATSTDLPVIRMFYRGRVIAQLPRGLEELKVDKRRKRNEQRRRARQEKVAARDESGSETGSDYESEDEREAETMVAMERYKWDRSKVSRGDNLLRARGSTEYFARKPRRNRSAVASS